MKIKKIIKKSRKLVDVTLSGLLQLFGLKKLNIFPDVYAYLYGSKNTRCILKTKKFIVLKSNDYLKITAAIDKGNEALSIEKNQFDKTNKS